MQIKRFEAKTMTLALKMVKDEFGPEAVILSARSLRRGRGILAAARPAGVEVTAAKDTAWAAYAPVHPVAAALPGDSRPAVAPEETYRRSGILQSLNHRLRALAVRPRLPAYRPADEDANGGRLSGFHASLLAQEVPRELAAEIVEHLKRLPGNGASGGPEGMKAQLVSILKDVGFRGGRPEETAGDGPGATAVVGPAGVGKTTAAVKLAARQILRHGRGTTGLVTLDDHRIGALGQLRIYAEILGAPLAVATSPAEASRALEELASCERLIVDTPGISPGEEERRSAVCRILEALKPAETHLLLPAGMRETDMRAVVDGWKEGGVTHLGFTRLDETAACGGLISMAVGAKLPVGILSTGPRVPEDLVLDGLDLLAERLLPAAARGTPSVHAGAAAGAPAAAPTGAVRLVANRNSDLYHLPDCKWVRKIKAGNLIAFATPREAQSGHFRPCRDCTPDAAAAGGEASFWTEVRRASGAR
jgi:flagellar biosynthesis protein FlhF